MYTCIRSYIYKNKYCSSLALCCNIFYFVFIIMLIDLFRSILSSLNFDTYMEEKSILHSKLSILCCSWLFTLKMIMTMLQSLNCLPTQMSQVKAHLSTPSCFQVSLIGQVTRYCISHFLMKKWQNKSIQCVKLTARLFLFFFYNCSDCNRQGFWVQCWVDIYCQQW